MEWLVIGLVACAASALTLFSGFGLGTLLLPAFAFFFPVELAVAMTAVVHFSNNLFKLILLGRRADLKVVLAFGLPGMLAAFGGALLLTHLSDLSTLGSWSLAGHDFEIHPVKLCLAAIMVLFAVLETYPAFSDRTYPPRYLPIGGL